MSRTTESKSITRSMRFRVSIDKQTPIQLLFQAKRESKEIQSLAIRLHVVFDTFKNRYKRQNDSDASIYNETGGNYKTIQGLIYNEIKGYDYCFSGSCLVATIRKGLQEYNYQKRLPNLADSQPIVMPTPTIIPLFTGNNVKKIKDRKLDFDHYRLSCTIFSKDFKKRMGLSSNVILTLLPKSSREKRVLECIRAGDYHIGRSELNFAKKNGKYEWYISLTYNYQLNNISTVKKPKRLGVYMSEHVAIYASSCDSFDVFKIEGDEVYSFSNRIEAIRRMKQRQATYCGDGRIGHGYKKRMQPVYNDNNAIANYRETKNHSFSRSLVEFAHKNNYTDIVLENLHNIKAELGFPKHLRHWTYKDLQDKISYKAEEYGIHVHFIDDDVSSICWKCGNKDVNNRERGVINRFKCMKCGFEADTDWNASHILSKAILPDLLPE